MFAFTKLMQAMVASGTVSDPQFYLTTLLLNTSSTNGAQNNTFLDSSTNNFTITRNGNTTQGTFTPFSQTGWGNYFNGSGDYLNTAANAAFAFGTASWTVEAWVYVTTLQEILLFDTRSSASTAGIGCRIAPDGTLSYSGSANNALTSTAITANTWNHIAWSYDGTTLSGYINGTRGGTATPSFNITQNNGYVGRVGFSAGGYMAGYISNLRVVKGTAVYSGTSFTVPTTPLTAITNTSLLTCQSNRFLDNSTNAFAITVNGTPSVQAFSPFAPTAAYDTAVVGGSGYFDGTGDYLSAASNAAFAFGTGDFTVEFWYYPAVINLTNNPFVDTRNAGGSTTGFFVKVGDGGTGGATTINATIGATTISQSGLFGSSWNHVAITRASNVCRVYVNGISGTSGTISTNLTDNGLLISKFIDSSNAINGYLSNIRIVKGTAVYTGTTLTIPTAPLTAISGTSLLLSATNAGIYDSAAKNDLETVGNAQVSTTQAKWGTTSMAFDGTGDYLVFPSSQNFSFGSGNYTVEVWVRSSSFTTNQGIFDTRNSGTSNNGIVVFFDTAGKLNFFMDGIVKITSASAYSTNTWYYLAVTRSGSTNTLYVNGSSVGTYASSTSLTDTSLCIGTVADFKDTSSTYKFNGYMDDFRITKGYARTIATPSSEFPIQ